MALLSTTISVVLAALCLFATGATAQTNGVAPETITTEPTFRLASVTIGHQAMLLVVPPEETEDPTGSVSEQSLATLLNFFLEVPAAPVKE